MTGHGSLMEQAPTTTTEESEWVRRFGLTERFAHWWTVLMVAVALGTGLALGDEGAESGTLLTAHWGAVVLLGVGLLAALALGDTRALLRATAQLFSIDRRDARRYATTHGVHSATGTVTTTACSTRRRRASPGRCPRLSRW